MADNISPVNLPPVASTSDAPPNDSGRGSNERNKKNKKAGEPNDEGAGQNAYTGSPQLKGREKKSPSADFERTDHELDSFA